MGFSATARQPDLIVHSEASDIAIMQDGKFLQFDAPPPILLVEIILSSDTDKKSRDRDYIDKRSEYAARGIPEYWIIDPIRATLLILILQDGQYVGPTLMGDQSIVSPSFPTMNLTVSQVFSAGR